MDNFFTALPDHCSFLCSEEDQNETFEFQPYIDFKTQQERNVDSILADSYPRFTTSTTDISSKPSLERFQIASPSVNLAYSRPENSQCLHTVNYSDSNARISAEASHNSLMPSTQEGFLQETDGLEISANDVNLISQLVPENHFLMGEPPAEGDPTNTFVENKDPCFQFRSDESDFNLCVGSTLATSRYNDTVSTNQTAHPLSIDSVISLTQSNHESTHEARQPTVELADSFWSLPNQFGEEPSHGHQENQDFQKTVLAICETGASSNGQAMFEHKSNESQCAYKQSCNVTSNAQDIQRTNEQTLTQNSDTVNGQWFFIQNNDSSKNCGLGATNMIQGSTQNGSIAYSNHVVFSQLLHDSSNAASTSLTQGLELSLHSSRKYKQMPREQIKWTRCNKDVDSVATLGTRNGYYPGNTPSRFCHICTRSMRPENVLVCSNLTKGTCRKVMCLRCIGDLGWDWHNEDKSSWTCSHCRQVRIHSIMICIVEGAILMKSCAFIWLP